MIADSPPEISSDSFGPSLGSGPPTLSAPMIITSRWADIASK